MKLQVYSVYDKAVNGFLPPFYVRSKGEAIRSFTDAANDAAHQFHKHAMDYVLMYLGTFDDGAGVFEQPAHTERVVTAQEVIVPEEPFTEETRVKAPRAVM